MIIKNANIFTQDGQFVTGDVTVDGDRFAAVLPETAQKDEVVLDAENLYMIPGLVDIHFHGCMGADMCDGTKEALDTMSSYEASIGVTSICPATMTIPKDELVSVMKNAGNTHIKVGLILLESIWKDHLSVLPKGRASGLKISCIVIMHILNSYKRCQAG